MEFRGILLIDVRCSFEKARKVLYAHWGFDDKMTHKGSVVMFHGSAGTGKSMAAETLGMLVGNKPN